MKRLQSLILFLTALLSISAEGLMAQKLRIETQDQQKYVIHRVQKGETLYSLSRAYEADVNELSRLNPEAAKVLKLGQEIRIPYSPPSVSKNLQSSAITQETKHTVQQGEWLSKIARNYEVSVGDLKKWNNLQSETLKPGQELIVGVGKSKSQKKNTSTRPSNNSTNNNTSTYAQNKTVNKTTPKNNLRSAASTEITHTVAAGETLYSLKRKYGADVNEIRSRNQLTSDVLSVGQTLQIPVNPNVNANNASSTNNTNTNNFQNPNLNQGNTTANNTNPTNNTYTPPTNNNNYQNPNTNTTNNQGTFRGSGLPKTQADKITHTVKEGEFLFDIAQAYGVNIRDVKAWNNLQSYYVEPGTNLVIYPNQKQGNTNPGTTTSLNPNSNPVNTGNTTWRGATPNTNVNSNTNPTQNNTPQNQNNNTNTSNPYANPYSNANYNYSTTSTSDDPIDQLNNSSINTQARNNNTYQSPNTSQSNPISTGNNYQTNTNSYPNYNNSQTQTNPYANPNPATNTNPNSSNIYNKKNVKEQGYADVLQNIPSPRPFVAMHREAPIGSLVIVKNTITKKTVVVEIVGQSNPNETKAGVVIELAPAAIQRLGGGGSQAVPVEITYMKK